jgi:transposase
MRKKQQRKSYTTEFKVKVALEAIKGQRTINEIATHYGVHPHLVTQWKKQAGASPARCLLDEARTRRRRRRGFESKTLPGDRPAQGRARLAQKKS